MRYGVPLRGTLRGYWKLRVGDYRIVFKIAGQEVRVLTILHRRDLYEAVAARLGRVRQELGRLRAEPAPGHGRRRRRAATASASRMTRRMLPPARA